MKANELMIGDWVMVNDIEHTHPLQVAEIFKKSGAYYATLYWDGMPDNVNPETLTADVEKVLPIPLTPEILEKNGWIKDGYFYRAKDGSYIQLGKLFEHATFNCKKGGINREVITSPSILKYVHQLQHALRVCGIEKEIEL